MSDPTTKPGTSSLKPSRPRKMPPIEQLRGRQLGRILIKMGKIRRAEVLEALEVQKQQRGPIGAILVHLGHITEEDLHLALGAQVGMEAVDLDDMDVPAEVIDLLADQVATTYKVIPIDYDAGRHELSVALGSPDNFQATDDLQTLMGFAIKGFIANPEAITRALDRYYPEEAQDSIQGLIEEIGADELILEPGDADRDQVDRLADVVAGR